MQLRWLCEIALSEKFVELLWQLSLHALRRSLSGHMQRKYLESAYAFIFLMLPSHMQLHFSAETGICASKFSSRTMNRRFIVFCAEEAYLQQELEKLHDLRNKVKMDLYLAQVRILICVACWSALHNFKIIDLVLLDDICSLHLSQHEVLASGPIEDLIAQREHRYRISGSSLLAAMDESTQVSSSNLDKDQADRSQAIVNRENVNESLSTCHSQTNDEKSSWIDDRSGRGQPTVDIAEVLMRWTHALQRIHKQSLHLAKANESLAATLAQHRQYLASIQAYLCLFISGKLIILFTLVPAQVLVNQLKGVGPAIQNSISELSDPQVTNYHRRSMESSSDEVTDVTSRLSSVQIDKVSSNPAALKLPPLFSLTPNSAAKIYKKQAQVNNNQMDNVSENLLLPNSHVVIHGSVAFY
ncbi:augmin subunit 6 [Tanacetum coccineum]